MYHRIVSADIDPWGKCYSKKNFTEHLEGLREKENLLPVVDLVEAQPTLPLGLYPLTVS